MSEFEEIKESLLLWQEELRVTQLGMDTLWIIFGSCLVFLMQCGFGMFEAGCVSSRNVVSIMYRNLMGTCISAVQFYCLGWGFAYGTDGNRFLGTNNFFMMDLPKTTSQGGTATVYTQAFVFFQFSLCTMSATIVSGALAERTQSIAYTSCSAFFSTIVFPIAAHWCWSNDGWASSKLEVHNGRIGMGVMDFSGAGTVCVLGGFAALAGAIVLGPRERQYKGKKIARFDANDTRKESILFSGHNKVFQVMGIMILWAGWFGYNLAGTGTLWNKGSRIAPRVSINTALGAAGGGFSVVVADTVIQLFHKRAKLKRKKPSRSWKMYAEHRGLQVKNDIPQNAILGYSVCYNLSNLCNGILAGLVSSTSGCAVLDPWASFVVSSIAGMVYGMSSNLIRRFHVDDPLDCFAIYGCGGLVSLLMTSLFAKPSHVTEVYGSEFTDNGYYGIVYGGNANQLGVQVVVGLTIAVWSFVLNIILFISLRKLEMLRLPENIHSLDVAVHHAHAYH